MTTTADAAGVTIGPDARVVLTQRHGHVLLITLNRPAARNAVNLAVTLALGDALEQAERDREIWVVVRTGAGDKAFCAGADLKAVARGESRTEQTDLDRCCKEIVAEQRVGHGQREPIHRAARRQAIALGAMTAAVLD